MDRKEVFERIEKERERQENIHPFSVRMIAEKKEIEQDPDMIALLNMIVNTEFLAVLTEETGEVAKAMQGEGDLKEELIQVASTAVRWLEKLN